MSRHLNPRRHTDCAAFTIFIKQCRAHFVFATLNHDLPANDDTGFFNMNAAINVYGQFTEQRRPSWFDGGKVARTIQRTPDEFRLYFALSIAKIRTWQPWSGHYIGIG